MGENSQRQITVSKQKCGKNNLYTINAIKALDEAANRFSGLTFKLYMYLAKNQDTYTFKLSNKDFFKWAGEGSRNTYYKAFNELVENGYLVQKEGTTNIYTFYDKSQLPIEDEDIIIQMPIEKVEARQAANKNMEGFVF